MKKLLVASILGLLMFLVGCTSSQPAPKPLSSVPQYSEDEMRKKIRDAEAKLPCSEANLKNASEEQRKKCDPTVGMFDNVKPKQQPVKKVSNTAQK
jgi:hypothetical protein